MPATLELFLNKSVERAVKMNSKIKYTSTVSTVNDYGCGVIALLDVFGHIVILSSDLWRHCNRFLKKEKSSPASPKKSYALNTT